METIRDIDISTEVGRVLLMTLGRLCTMPGYTDKGPDEVLQEMVELTKAAFPNES
jgi:hypothetical protein